MEHDGAFPVIFAGAYPEELLEVCALWRVMPQQLLAWSVRKDGVSVVLPSGQKVGASVRGEWSIHGRVKPTGLIDPGLVPKPVELPADPDTIPELVTDPAAAAAPGATKEKPARKGK